MTDLDLVALRQLAADPRVSNWPGSTVLALLDRLEAAERQLADLAAAVGKWAVGDPTAPTLVIRDEQPEHG